jgi:hypothetical protein
MGGPDALPIPIPNLIAWWKLDEGSGSTTMDSSGHGHAATLANGPAWVPGRFGDGLSFDGIDDQVYAGTSADLDLTSSFTITAWINPRSYGGGGLGRIVERRGPASGVTFLVDANVKGIDLVSNLATPSETIYSVVNACHLGSWQHVAATFDSRTLSVALYVNGAAAGGGTWPANAMTTASPLYVGGHPQQGVDDNRTFDGILDEVRIYDRALSGIEIQGIFAEVPQ